MGSPGIGTALALGLLAALAVLVARNPERESGPEAAENGRATAGSEVEGVKAEVARMQARLRAVLHEQRKGAQYAQQIGAFQEDLARIKRQLDELAGGPESRVNAKVKAAEAEDSSEALESKSLGELEQAEAAERQRLTQYTAVLDGKLDGESYDNRWAEQIESSLTRAFNGNDRAGTQLLSAACRSTLCRIEVAHENPKAESQFLARIGTLQAFGNTRAFYQRVAGQNGGSVTVFYAAREGHQLPVMQ